MGDALTELGLIEGEDSEYGLYVKTVNGITADYDTDGHYWAFYVDGEYAQTGVDATRSPPGQATPSKWSKMKLSVREIAVFGMLGALMYASKVLMEALPNVHLLGVFVVALTVVYRKKALYPIYTYVLINGLMAGFALWWLPYLYLWAVLWAWVMLLPRQLPPRIRPAVYMAVCAAHGFLFGTLYAPAPGAALRAGFPRHDRLDCGRTALGLRPRRQQLFLRAAHLPAHRPAAEGRKSGLQILKKKRRLFRRTASAFVLFRCLGRPQQFLRRQAEKPCQRQQVGGAGVGFSGFPNLKR